MAETLSVLIIGPTPPPYHGVAVATRALLDRGLGPGFRVQHLDLADRRGIQHVDRPDAYDVVLFVAQWISLVGMLMTSRPHVVYLPVSQSTIGFVRDSFFMWPACLAGSRPVFHLHGGQFRVWYDGRHRIVKAYIRAVLRRVTRVIVLGESLRPVFEGLVDSKRIDAVPNGVADPARPVAPAVSGRSRVLHVGTLSRAKGTFALLAAVERVVALREDVDFVLAGPWLREEDRREAEDVVARSGLTGHVTFPGQVDGPRKAELLATADVFVFPGLQQEGQPLVVLEAMAAGLPVVFTDRGCLRETVVDGATGCVVKTGDVDDLARVLLRLIEHPEEGRRLGAAGRRRYEALYTLDRFAGRMIDVFARAVQEGR